VIFVPVKPCQKDNKPGYKYGDSGHCYTYTEGDIKSEKEAWDKAVAQGRAIEKSKGNW